MATERLPTYLVGRNCSMAKVTPAGAIVDGTFEFGTTYSLLDLGVFDHFEFEGNLNLEEISPLDYRIRNYVPTKDDFTVTVGEIEESDGESVLIYTWGLADYFRMAARATFPGIGGFNGPQLVVFAVRDSFRKGFVEGKNAVLMTGRPCGIFPQFTANPTI